MKKVLKKLALVLLVTGLSMPALAWDDDGDWGSDDNWGDSGGDDWGSESGGGNDDWDGGSGDDDWGISGGAVSNAPIGNAPIGNAPVGGAPVPRYMTNPMNRNQIVQGIIDNRNAPDRWQNSPKSVFWEDYRGNSVRIELLRTNSDMKEMRLKFVQTAGIYSNPDGTIAEMLSRVSARTMKRVCGRRAISATVLYERPGIEYMRMTTADPFFPTTGGTLIEYGFRCVY